MQVKKTIQAGLVNLTKVKHDILTKEYENLQTYLQTGNEGIELYSANRQQADRYYDKIKEDKEYPLSLRKDLINLQLCDSDVADYFLKIPVKGRYGGLKVPINTHQDIDPEWELCESKLYRQEDKFFVNITVQREVEEKKGYSGILGIDLGLRNPVVGAALSVAGHSTEVKGVLFRGDEIRNTQTRYFYLRRQSKTGKGWKRREYNKVRDQLHKVTTKIADYAAENRLIVSVGDLGGIQKQDKGRTMNRKLHRFPHYSFRQMLKYKCRERGIRYIEVSEAYTSQTCSRCGKRGDRNKGIFTCPHCGYEVNSDVNGAVNIAKRALGKSEIRPLLGAGGSVASPEPRSHEPTSTTPTEVTAS